MTKSGIENHVAQDLFQLTILHQVDIQENTGWHDDELVVCQRNAEGAGAGCEWNSRKTKFCIAKT